MAQVGVKRRKTNSDVNDLTLDPSLALSGQSESAIIEEEAYHSPSRMQSIIYN